MNELVSYTTELLPVERVTGGVMVIDSNHAQIHAGNAFSLGEVFTIAAGATVDVTVQVPAGAYVHYQATDLSTDGGNTVTAILYEGATVTAATGTAITPVNRRRLDTPDTSLLAIKQGATVTATGSRIDQWYFPKAADKGVMVSISKSDTNEWVLKQDTTYLLRISNTGATTSAVVSMRPFWYEEAAA
jgi:hypothetical protein